MAINNTAQSPLLSGVQNSGGWGNALKGLIQLPGAWMNQVRSASQSQNLAGGVAGSPYLNAAGNMVTNPNPGKIPLQTASNPSTPATTKPLSGGGTQNNKSPVIPPSINAGGTSGNNVGSTMNGTGFNSTIGGQAQGGLSQAQIDAANSATQGQQGGYAYNTPGGTIGVGNTNGTNTPPTGTPGTPQTPPPTTFPGYVGALGATANQSSPQYQAAQTQYNTANQQLEQLKAAAANNQFIGAGTNMAEYAGTQGLLANRLANEENALTGEMTAAQSAAQTATGQQNTQQSGLNNAAGLVSPQLGGYNQQPFNPLTGQFSGGSGGSLDTALQHVITGLQNHTMSYGDAQTALSGYGQGGLNALTDWATKNNFNISQSNTLAQQQGSIGPAYSFAKSALTNLQNLVQQLGVGQGTNIPAVNGIGNWISTTFGVNSDKTRQYMGAVQEARNAYSQLLAASKGGTPTDYGNQATTAIPDNATPNDIQAAINNLESLGQSKLDIYGNPGQSTTNETTNTNSGSLYSF